MPPRIGFICPTFNHYIYAVDACRSFFKYTPGGYCIVLDDCGTNWTPDWQRKFSECMPHPRGECGMYIYRFPTWGGVTRSWNHGLQVAKQQGLDFCVAGNDDILFTKGWYEPLVEALNSGYHLVGPVSNAPGYGSLGKAGVWKYIPNWKLTDNQEYLDSVARALRSQFNGQVVDARINGFFMMAKTATWWDGAYSAHDVFRPSNDFKPDGRRNTTPLMTGNEDELQDRWLARDRKTAIVPSSFIFHYRSVSRGDKYLNGQQWMRKK